ncbi:MAG: hypothetical protein XD40_0385 [Archaeoglobus fulgidus]|jgi:hypothetical protein|uniref:Mut7-C RNAse domain-containing protein n=1 Tax=Archaeoglobus fulgidus TaxID=2234 RepID=A0A101E054_ARCFL|nr:MAG: hypothetical protein XD40_0385 [Archaeoglobus fulgidus]KUK05925.1 MAG: hypothetical protein XD48_1841 [Archaeoglobus fulgidus]
MVEMKFLTDRMLGRLTRWLRISGYDTVSVSELEFDEEEDEFMLRNLRERILLTKDRELYRKSVKEGRKAILIRSDSLEGQMRELMERGVKFQIVMDRCSLCNTPLRKPSREEAMEVIEREKLSEDMLEFELWYCEKCRKLYWMGGHWKNMTRFLRKFES